ncbi:hypothetical protein PAMP_010206 [Pampus punctatissimus]
MTLLAKRPSLDLRLAPVKDVQQASEGEKARLEPEDSIHLNICCHCEREILLFPIWPHCLGNAVQCAPLQSMLPALLVENKLLVSQRRAGGLWTQKCVRCGPPMRVAGRFHPTASGKPAEEMENVP